MLLSICNVPPPLLLLWFVVSVILSLLAPRCHCYCLGDLRKRDIAGVWRLRSKGSYLPSLVTINEDNTNAARRRPMKEFTVYPPKVPPTKMRSIEQQQAEKKGEKHQGNDILLLLREDGNFVRYESLEENNKSNPMDGTGAESCSLEIIKGCWGLVDGRLILAADRPDDTTNIRSDAKRHDTILCGEIKAKCSNYEKLGASSATTKQEDVHLTVEGEVSIGKFFYPQSHPSFFEQPMVGATPTGSFELRQILGNLNAQAKSYQDNDFVEKFRKQDLMNKRYFLTSYPLPNRRQKRKRWSIKYNRYVDEKPPSQSEKDLEEIEKNSPMQIKAFEVELYANNTFSSITGLGDTILRGKWSIIGEERDQLWMSVWRFGFGRSVSGSTYSEGLHLNHQDDVSYWGKIYEVDGAAEENFIHDEPIDWKGTRIEVNGAVMVGIGLEPCSVARFTMIEKTEQDNDEEYDDDDLDDLPLDIGSFE
jgi:hypothetical protein